MSTQNNVNQRTRGEREREREWEMKPVMKPCREERGMVGEGKMQVDLIEDYRL